MFRSTDDVTRALRSLGRSTGTRSTSVLQQPSSSYGVDSDPFHGGFLDTLEARTEVLSRFARLDERERAVLTLWYVQDLAVPSICDALGMSRATCYRIRDRALERMLGIAVTAEPSHVHASASAVA